MIQPGFLIDDRFQLHDPGASHPESPRRLREIKHALEDFGTAERWHRIAPRLALPEELEWIHTREHIRRVRHASLQAPAYLDPDTPVSKASYETGLLASGSVAACVQTAFAGGPARSFAFVRPPGHHAEAGRAMGFCLFNNVALGAAYLRRIHRLERVAVVDFDIHHGNGTQAIFYEDPGVLYLSTHQYPFYPGTGSFSERGRGNGQGYTVNFPLPAGTGDAVILPIYSRIFASILEQYRPQFLLVSAGFDALAGDPLGGLVMTPAGIGSLAGSLIRSAEACCNGRICFVLEGGYSPAGLRDCTRAVLSEMEREVPEELPVHENPDFDEISRIAQREFGGHWKW